MVRWRVAVIILLIFLVVSAALSYYLFDLASGYYRDLNTTRLNPLMLDAFPTSIAEELTTTAEQHVVFFGDSRMEQWPTPEGLPQFVFVNRGIGSQTSAQVTLRFDAHVRSLMPDILVVQVCVNDLKTLPLFPERQTAIIESCQHHLDSIVEQAREIDALVILTTVFPVGEPPVQRWPVWSDAIAESIKVVNNHILSLETENVLVLDAYTLLADERGLLHRELSADELHLNAAGYAVLNEQLVTLLRNMGD